MRYQDWWMSLPAPRSWRRQHLVDALTHRRALVEKTRKEIAENQGRIATLQLRLGSLDSRTDLTPEQSREAVEFRSEIASLQNYLKIDLPLALNLFERSVKETEDELREFDRQK
jgi:hypothetical protein